jgi:hypothetical protein
MPRGRGGCGGGYLMVGLPSSILLHSQPSRSYGAHLQIIEDKSGPIFLIIVLYLPLDIYIGDVG